MRASLARYAGRIWYRPAPPVWLLPAAWLFGLGVRIRRTAYRSGLLPTQQVDVPLIVVGNISVGGTGKTPCVAWLAGVLAAAGYRPGIVSRGYGGRPHRRPHLVTNGDDAAQVGDEPLLLHRQTGLPVSVCIDRVAAARALVQQGVDVIVADDGLQHYRLGRDIEIAVVDGERLLGNGSLLPAGPLREPAGRLQTVDLVLVNGGAGLPGAYRVHLEITGLTSLDGAAQVPLAALAGQRVRLIAGIGHPERVQRALEAAGIAVAPVPVADHGRADPQALLAEPALPLLMTAKDAVKYPELDRPAVWVIQVRLVVPEPVRSKLLERLAGCRR